MFVHQHVQHLLQSSLFSCSSPNLRSQPVCCEAINSCVYPGTCPIPGALPPPNPPTSCAGMPDGKNICLSSSTFNTCLNGGFASVLPQPCATGTVCCTALGVCVMQAPAPSPMAYRQLRLTQAPHRLQYSLARPALVQLTAVLFAYLHRLLIFA
ncbi:hypothetical protein BC829DRAFT_41939 [Chytridium lagenaria]|nr:hypothetical protein BC829DRAFT_41939 [Chytridium lagenaria]